jgi:FtsZ-binding cell division protein ZapB
VSEFDEIRQKVVELVHCSKSKAQYFSNKLSQVQKQIQVDSQAREANSNRIQEEIQNAIERTKYIGENISNFNQESIQLKHMANFLEANNDALKQENIYLKERLIEVNLDYSKMV